MILITGGTGVMGTALVQRLRAKGRPVRVLALAGDRGAAGVETLGAEARSGDVSRVEDVAGACDGVETVYHLAAVIVAFDDAVYQRVNVGGTANVVAEARRAGVKHFVHVSSASVVYPKTTAYSRSKREAERIVRESGIGYTIVRPTLVYDDRRGAQEFDDFLAYLRRFPVVPFIGSGRARKRPVHASDVVAGLTAIEGNGKAIGKVYNLSGREVITMRAFARLCLRLLGQERKPVVALPVWFCHAASWLMGVAMTRPPLRWPVIAGVTQDADLDPSEACRDLGYAPSRVSERLPSCFPREA